MTEHLPHFHYTVYGQRLCSTIHLAELPASCFAERDISFAYPQRMDQPLCNEGTELIDRRPTNLGCDISVHRTHHGYLLEWEKLCQFHVSSNGSVITSSADADIGYNWITATLYGMVLSFALHVKGIHNLHGSAVTVGNRAIGFLADPGSGKSSLAAAFAAGGAEFLTDDVLALQIVNGDYMAYPGFPYASLSPEVADLLQLKCREAVPLNSDKGRVAVDGTWASFAKEPASVQYLFTLDRSTEADHVSLRRLPQTEAIRCLLENTNVLPLLPVHLKQSQLAFVTRLAAEVPIWRLTYPTGFVHLPEIVDEVTGLTASPVA